MQCYYLPVSVCALCCSPSVERRLGGDVEPLCLGARRGECREGRKGREGGEGREGRDGQRRAWWRRRVAGCERPAAAGHDAGTGGSGGNSQRRGGAAGRAAGSSVEEGRVWMTERQEGQVG